MSDLISRSELLKKMNDTGVQITFDLPVEEILGEDVDIDDFAMLVQDAIQAYKNMVIGTIKEQPTAYDVSKVVEELEEEREIAYADFPKYVNEYSPCLDEEYDDFFHRGLERAIKLVRKGGAE